MRRIELGGPRPALTGARRVPALEGDVPQLEEKVVAEAWIELGGALVRFEGVVVAAGAVTEVGNVLRQLRQRRVVRVRGTEQRFRARRIPRRLEQHREIVPQYRV